jgi:hypothetical protein
VSIPIFHVRLFCPFTVYVKSDVLNHSSNVPESKPHCQVALHPGSALISERGSVSRSTSPLQIKPLRVTDPRSVFKLSHYLHPSLNAWQTGDSAFAQTVAANSRLSGLTIKKRAADVSAALCESDGL